MEKEYNRENINKNLSMGENGFLYYDDIEDHNSMHRIILSTIFNLHKKGYVKINNSSENELILELKEGTKDLKLSESYIYECLKHMDVDGNCVISLDEFYSDKNIIFAKSKRNIREIIFEEAMEDGLVDTTRFALKRKFLFRSIILTVLLISCLLADVSSIIRSFSLAVLLVCIIYFAKHKSEFIRFSAKTISFLKEKLAGKYIMKYNSSNEIIRALLEFIICFFAYFAHLRILYKVLGSIVYFKIITFLIPIEIAIIIFLIIFFYMKSKKIDVYTNTAITTKENLIGLKNFLEDYSLIDKREALEVYLWEDYLSFAILFGINNKITKQLNIHMPNIAPNSKIQFDYYENKYFYINNFQKKVYIDD